MTNASDIEYSINQTTVRMSKIEKFQNRANSVIPSKSHKLLIS